MALGNMRMLQTIKNISYLPRGVSDHSPLVLVLNLGEKRVLRTWRINPYWLEIIKKSDEVLPKLREFVEYNRGTASAGILWDTLKAFLRGI